jgi:hypothetical protein
MHLKSYYLYAIYLYAILGGVSWIVEIVDEFAREFFPLPEDVRVEVLALSRVLQHLGPRLGRPHIDTL